MGKVLGQNAFIRFFCLNLVRGRKSSKIAITPKELNMGTNPFRFLLVSPSPTYEQNMSLIGDSHLGTFPRQHFQKYPRYSGSFTQLVSPSKGYSINYSSDQLILALCIGPIPLGSDRLYWRLCHFIIFNIAKVKYLQTCIVVACLTLDLRSWSEIRITVADLTLNLAYRLLDTDQILVLCM